MKQIESISIPKNLPNGSSSNGIVQETSDVLPFPVHIFPDVVKEYINACTDSLNLVPDFMGIGVLSMVATLLGNSYTIKIKEGWIERPIIWLAIVGYSGIRKTPSLNAVIQPLQKIDKRLYAEFCRDLEEYKLREVDSSIQSPIAKQLVVTDTTIEALIPVLKDNPNGVLYFKDELIAWVNDLTRYNKGSAEQQWLSLYSNQPIRLNRKTSEDNTRVDHPFANVLGGIQPEILSALFENGRGINGFTSRILFSFPEPIKRQTSQKSIDTQLPADYDNFIHRFLYLEQQKSDTGQIEPITLGFSSDAQELFYKWNEVFINNKLNDSAVPEIIKSALSKLEALMPRLALIIQFIDDIGVQRKEPQQVEDMAVNKAIILSDYFYSHFLKVYAKVNNSGFDAISRQQALLENFSSHILKGYSKEEAVQLLLSNKFTNAEIARALKTSKSNISFWAGK